MPTKIQKKWAWVLCQTRRIYVWIYILLCGVILFMAFETLTGWRFIPAYLKQKCKALSLWSFFFPFVIFQRESHLGWWLEQIWSPGNRDGSFFFFIVAMPSKLETHAPPEPALVPHWLCGGAHVHLQYGVADSTSHWLRREMWAFHSPVYSLSEGGLSSASTWTIALWGKIGKCTLNAEFLSEGKRRVTGWSLQSSLQIPNRPLQWTLVFAEIPEFECRGKHQHNLLRWCQWNYYFKCLFLPLLLFEFFCCSFPLLEIQIF